MKSFLGARREDGSCCALRTLGEVYVTLTGLPVRPRITGPEALSVIDQISECLLVVSLNDTEYRAAFQKLAEAGIIGAAAYDFLIAQCAIKVSADVILTWNVRDFVRFGPEIASRVRTPLEGMIR